MSFESENRDLQVTTVLGQDVLELIRFRGEEGLSELSTFELDFVSRNAAVEAEDIIGTSVTVTLKLEAGGVRHFHGYVHSFFALDERERGTRNYRAIVVPWLWFLTQTTDCRVFQEKTIVEIIESVFNDLGFADYTTSRVLGSNTKRKRNYCVQYRESDFDFVSRLIEEEGIFYFFEHSDGKHTLHLADSIAAYKECAESKVDCPPIEQSSRYTVSHITHWEHQYRFRPGAWAHADYNFKNPYQPLLASETTLMKFKGVKDFERYDFPGEFRALEYGRELARVRMEELEADHNVVKGSSFCRTFSPSLTFKVGVHRSKNEAGKTYTIQRVVHVAEQPNYETSGGGSAISYINDFECFPSSMTFRPPRKTPKPIIPGCQTAVVTGPPGEKIYTDEHERVKVQFFWDRYGKNDENSSCWIRVAQEWAGVGWGMVHIPHVGQEVVLMFQDGDPDQPIIIGRVFNAGQKVPLSLPASKTQSIMRDHGGNQTIMEGAPGKQFILISQKRSGS
ncbi:MAG: type VI secretion system tip protein VgrG [Pirellula sp.]|nr:type VI secretion system tip protein VgrG [Pirellula sp.]